MLRRWLAAVVEVVGAFWVFFWSSVSLGLSLSDISLHCVMGSGLLCVGWKVDFLEDRGIGPRDLPNRLHLIAAVGAMALMYKEKVV